MESCFCESGGVATPAALAAATRGGLILSSWVGRADAMLALRPCPEAPRGLGPPKKAAALCGSPRGGGGGRDVILTLDQLMKRDGGAGGATPPKETEPTNGLRHTKKKAACLSGVLEEIAKLSQDFSTYQEELRRKSNTSSPRSASSLSCACNGAETTPGATPSPPPTSTPTPSGHDPTEQMMNERNTWLSFHLGAAAEEEEEEDRERACPAIPPTVPPRNASIVLLPHTSAPCAPPKNSRLVQLMMQQQQQSDRRSHAAAAKASPMRQGAAKSAGAAGRSSNGSNSSRSNGSMKAPATPELGSRAREHGVCGHVGSPDAAPPRGHAVSGGRSDAMQDSQPSGTLPPLQTRFSLPARPSKRRLPSRWAGRAPAPDTPSSARQGPPARQEPTARPAPKGGRAPPACAPAARGARSPVDSYNIHDIMDILSWGDLRSSVV